MKAWQRKKHKQHTPHIAAWRLTEDAEQRVERNRYHWQRTAVMEMPCWWLADNSNPAAYWSVLQRMFSAEMEYRSEGELTPAGD